MLSPITQGRQPYEDRPESPGIARDRRNLVIPITAISRDYGDFGDSTGRTP